MTQPSKRPTEPGIEPLSVKLQETARYFRMMAATHKASGDTGEALYAAYSDCARRLESLLSAPAEPPIIDEALAKPHADTLQNALSEVEKIQQGMRLASGERSQEILREARAGAMYDAPQADKPAVASGAALDLEVAAKKMPPGLDQVPGKMGGRICIKGHRFTAANMIAELAERSIEEFANDYDFDLAKVKLAIVGVSMLVGELDERTRKPHAVSPPAPEGELPGVWIALADLQNLKSPATAPAAEGQVESELKHGMNCAALVAGDCDADCTCGLEWRIQIAQLREQLAEMEKERDSLKEQLRRVDSVVAQRVNTETRFLLDDTYMETPDHDAGKALLLLRETVSKFKAQFNSILVGHTATVKRAESTEQKLSELQRQLEAKGT